MFSSAEAKLCLLSAGTARSRAASREDMEALIRSLDWHQLRSKLESQSVLSLIGGRILDVSGSIAPGWFRSAVSRDRDETAAREAGLELLTIQVVDALRRAAIDCAALKGPLLARALYDEPGYRTDGLRYRHPHS